MGNETKWTPGPWTPIRQSDNSFNIRAVGSLVAQVIPQRSARANAALIAAAPVLYAAVADALRWIEALPDDLRLGSIMPDKLRAALAKAEGR